MTRQLFATDASVYEQIPQAVANPADNDDLRTLIAFANQHKTSLIPRTAGTSLAGQVVGHGIIVDVSRHMTRILEIDPVQQRARVQPGVIRNELNMALAPHGLLFGPETSTSNRAMIGGMLGNNSCGANSIVYGATREQTLSVSGFLSDGSYTTFGPLDRGQLEAILANPQPTMAERIVQQMVALLQPAEVQQAIKSQFPKPTVTRRNTGYALDTLLSQQPFAETAEPFNLAKLIAGSEGTLFFATEIELKCHRLPSTHRVLIASHFADLASSLYATQIAMRHSVTACELIDEHILAGATRNREQASNRRFVEGDPAAILLTEVRAESDEAAMRAAQTIVQSLQAANLGYAHPCFANAASEPIWELRKAGLGIAASVVGDAKPVTVIEDTAVSVDDFPAYILELGAMLQTRFQTSCVHYGHAGAGELHLRPMINLKDTDGLKRFREIGTEVAKLVKKYGGSLSGEHGDGRLRGEFLPLMLGAKNYESLRQVKRIWDPDGRFNPGKIVDAPAMDSALRTRVDEQPSPSIETVLNFDATEGLLWATEMCSGSGDCRKTHLSGGTMCPSYMATRNEKDSTRARANIMRHVLTGATDRRELASPMLKEVMDLCLSCKGCKRECPSNVDVGKLKAEFTQAYYDVHGVPLRAKMIASVDRVHRLASWAPGVYNGMLNFSWTAAIIKRVLGFHPKRHLPNLRSPSLRAWFAKRNPSGSALGHRPENQPPENRRPENRRPENQRRVLLFCDEFTNYLDTEIGIAAIELLEGLGYRVELPEHAESGRAALSKGLLRQARQVAEVNVRQLAPLVDEQTSLVGIEPSALLSLTDEYLDLVPSSLASQAAHLARHSLLLDSWLVQEWEAGRIAASAFTDEPLDLRVHGHCHQKAVGRFADTLRMLQIPANYRAKVIPSGCCGMAGSFGYEEEHYDLSMQIGELVLFPAIRKAPAESVIVAPGTSCRHQILDGTGRRALHPIQILRQALR